MVRAIEPTWSVENVTPSDEGSDYVFFLTVTTPAVQKEVVLKACSGQVVAPSVARAEPHILEILANETVIPVPEVIGSVDAHDELPAPFFLTEHVSGTNGSDEFDDLAPAVLDRILGEAGIHLAELHDVRSFNTFGQIGLKKGTLAVIDDEIGQQEEWTDWLLADAENTLDGMAGGRFDDIIPGIRDYLRESIPTLDSPDEAVLVDWDYRLGNLLIDEEASEITAVLDWADLVAGDPVYNLVTVEDHNINWQTRDPTLRDRLRERLYRTYEERRGSERPTDFDDRREIYRLCYQLNAMACLPNWYTRETARDRRAAEHRAFVEGYLK